MISLEFVVKEFTSKGIPLKEMEKLKEIAGGDPAILKRYAFRRLFHEPLAYIEREITFFGRKFLVDRRVYVPNPETEKLVEGVLRELGRNQELRILDVGTGCGNIAITLKKEAPSSSVSSCDISPDSLSIASKNAQIHHANIELFESYYVDDLPQVKPEIIVSDMPYGNLKYTLPSIHIEELRHMPPGSIFHPNGPLEAYKELISSIQRKGWHSLLFIETGRVEKECVKEIIPSKSSWEYNKINNYSFTKIQL